MLFAIFLGFQVTFHEGVVRFLLARMVALIKDKEWECCKWWNLLWDQVVFQNLWCQHKNVIFWQQTVELHVEFFAFTCHQHRLVMRKRDFSKQNYFFSWILTWSLYTKSIYIFKHTHQNQRRHELLVEWKKMLTNCCHLPIHKIMGGVWQNLIGLNVPSVYNCLSFLPALVQRLLSDCQLCGNN